MFFAGYGLYSSLSVQNTQPLAYAQIEDSSPFRSLIKDTIFGCRIEDKIEFLEYKSESPANPKNNKFGLYIYAENSKYVKIADELVNSNGGDWGYVLLPYNIRDRDESKWSRVFNDLHKKHLIPIVQLYDVQIDTYKEDTTKAARFLNSFVWPVKERYISVYNEPNDKRFWRDELNPGQYADVLDYTIGAFKQENTGFFMLNGALNASLPNNPAQGYMSAENFIRELNKQEPGIFEKLDGWASHSYPQPNFSGSPSATGWWSIRAYEEELKVLKEIGVKKDLPVFITETGWAHAEGDSYNNSYVSSQRAGEYMKEAYEKVWLPDSRVRAVTPFTIYYRPPNDHFAWVDEDLKPYAQYDIIKNMEKTAGTPYIAQKSVFSSFLCK